MPAPASGHGFGTATDTYDLAVPPEPGYRPTIKRALYWTDAVGGEVLASDDGAAADVYETEVAYMLPRGGIASGVDAPERMGRAFRDKQTLTYYAPTEVRPFGPLIDCSAGVPVAVLSMTWDDRPDMRAPLYPCTIRMRYLGGFTPIMRSIPPVLARGHAVTRIADPRRTYTPMPTVAGRVAWAAQQRGVPSTTILLRGLTQAEAEHLVEWSLWLRAGSFTYTPNSSVGDAVYRPFGPLLTDRFYSSKIRDLRITQPWPWHWDAELDLVSTRTEA